jgi:hypothetical protein
VSISLKVVFPNVLTLTVWATDDLLMPTGGAGMGEIPQGVLLTWSKYRGPGMVTFGEEKQVVDKKTNKATTTATFSEPGEYILYLLVSDGSYQPQQCCWTNGYIKVSVTSPTSQGR